MIIVFVGAVLFMIFALYGIMSKNAVPVAIKECQTLCKYANDENVSMGEGPCLSELYPDKWKVPGWVCDVAHAPRQSVDDLPENQCRAFREGRAQHFVELDENCNVIRVY